MSRLFVPGLIVFVVTACGGQQSEPAPPPAPEVGPVPQAVAETVVVRDTVRIRDPELEQRIARLELQLLEREARIGELQSRLDEAQNSVVQAMAKLQTAATRAEAASGMAEAELAIESRQRAGSPGGGDLAQAKRLMELGTDAFNKGNYGGALYLAGQAKVLAAPARAAPGGERAVRGEVPFASPVTLKVSSRSNVRAGPGTGFRVLFTLEAGTTVTGHSHTEGWVRITDPSGRSGWVSRALVGTRSGDQR